MLVQNKNYPLDQSPFYKLKTKAKLARLLKTSTKQLNLLKSDNNYRTFLKDGKTVVHPSFHLKKVQSRFLDLLKKIETPEWYFSKKGKTHISNARRHQNGDYCLTVDVKGFYENSKREYVFRFFKYQMEQSNDVAFFISELLTYKGYLPRGSPTSSLISFWAFKRAFENINKEAEYRGLIMSLWVDDLAFSSNSPIQKKFPYVINKILAGVSHKLKPAKILFYKKTDYKKITGCMVDKNSELLAPNKLRHKIVTDLKANTVERLQDKKVQSVIGRINSVQQIQKELFSSSIKVIKNQRVSKP